MFGNNRHHYSPDSGGGPLSPKRSGRRQLKIGIALSGGAARGWAHIGVLRALAESGIKADIVAGTSIGAVVGGCAAAGMLDELEAFARGLTRRRVFGLLDLNFAGSGLITGNRLSKLLEAQLGDRLIEDLEQRFVCVATELGTGHEIWISRGPIVEAMRASYALPGVFQPMLVGDRWLVDGALVNPVPVSVCRALGADIVIAVNPNADVFGRGTVIQDHSGDPIAEQALEATAEALGDGQGARRMLRRQLIGRRHGAPGISAVMVQAFNIIQDRIARSRLAGDPPDVMIAAKMSHVGLFEFHRAAKSIDLGYEAARRSATEIAEALGEPV